MPIEDTTMLNTHRSLYYRIWAILRQQGWYTPVTRLPLEPIVGEGIPPLTFGVPHGKPWVFLDETMEPWPQGIAIYHDQGPISRDQAIVDYRNARLTLPAEPRGQVSIDALVSVAHVLEAYPENEELEILDLPVISVEVNDQDSESFAIGQMSRFRNRSGTIDILSTRGPQRLELLNDLQKLIVATEYVDMSEHQILGENGDLDPAFSWNQSRGRMTLSRDPRGTCLAPRQGGSDKERYRAMISFEFVRVE